ncbi:MAG: amidohydrolase family protein [Bacteroidota bacterium]
MSIYLTDATHIDWKTLKFTQSHIRIDKGKNGKIHFVRSVPLKTRPGQIIDCKGKIVTKSFANTHHHVYSALSRGMPQPAQPPENFYEILKYIWWNLDKKLDLNMIEAGALYTAMASLKAGVTIVIDHHASPFAIDGSLGTIAGAFEFVGASHLLCYEVSDRDGMQKSLEGLAQNEEYLKSYKGLVGLHASFTLSDHTLRRAAGLMEKYGTGAHIHVAEDKYDQEHSSINYHKRVVERLKEFGLLDSSKSILAHCLHLDNAERKMIAASKAWVVENMESNLNNRVGLFNARDLGDRILLGTDGMHSDMIRSAQYAYFCGLKHDSVTPESIYKRLRNANVYFEKNGFEGDDENNLVVLDYDSPTPVTPENFHAHFVYGLNSAHVRHVISNGEIVVRDRKLVQMKEEDILKFANEMAGRLWKKLKG